MADSRSDVSGKDTAKDSHFSLDAECNRPVKLDRHGLPLVPQPTTHPSDPLNWPFFQKAYIALLVSLLAFTSQLTSALPNPAFNVIAADLGISVTSASYITTVWILFAGITPMFLVPVANVYGRRPLYVIGTLVAVAASVGSASASSYGGVMTGRVFNGIASSVPLGFGAATICDLFPQGERGLWIGIYTVSYDCASVFLASETVNVLILCKQNHKWSPCKSNRRWFYYGEP